MANITINYNNMTINLKRTNANGVCEYLNLSYLKDTNYRLHRITKQSYGIVIEYRTPIKDKARQHIYKYDNNEPLEMQIKNAVIEWLNFATQYNATRCFTNKKGAAYVGSSEWKRLLIAHKKAVNKK